MFVHDNILYLAQPNMEFECFNHKDIHKCSASVLSSALYQFGACIPLVTISVDSENATECVVQVREAIDVLDL